jgi:hypothetical protein
MNEGELVFLNSRIYWFKTGKWSLKIKTPVLFIKEINLEKLTDVDGQTEHVSVHDMFEGKNNFHCSTYLIFINGEFATIYLSRIQVVPVNDIEKPHAL